MNSEKLRHQPAKKAEGKNFTCIEAGKFADLNQYALKHPLLSRETEGKLLLKESLGLTAMQVSLNKLPAGKAVPFYHQHKQNEELYIFTGGKGQMQVDGETIDVQEGTVIRVGTNGSRTWRNNSDQDLYYIVIQAKEKSLSIDTFDDGIPGKDPVTWPN